MADIVNLTGAAGMADAASEADAASKVGLRDVIFGEGREIGKSYSCLGKFPSGITIVSYYGTDNRDPVGLTVSLFTPISLDPPIVQVSIEKLAKAYRELEGKSFTVNFLLAEQEKLAVYFGGRTRDKVAIEWEEGTFSPRLKDSLAWLECTPSDFTEYGDHRQYIGGVYQFAFSGGAPLVFFDGKFGRIVPLRGMV